MRMRSFESSVQATSGPPQLHTALGKIPRQIRANELLQNASKFSPDLTQQTWRKRKHALVRDHVPLTEKVKDRDIKPGSSRSITTVASSTFPYCNPKHPCSNRESSFCQAVVKDKRTAARTKKNYRPGRSAHAGLHSASGKRGCRRKACCSHLPLHRRRRHHHIHLLHHQLVAVARDHRGVGCGIEIFGALLRTTSEKKTVEGACGVCQN